MAKKNLTIYMIQPAIPHYRLFLFDYLNEYFEFKVFYSGGDINNKFQKVDRPYSNFLGDIKSFLSIFRWQGGVTQLNITDADMVIINGNLRFLSNFPIILKSYLRGKKLIWWGHFPNHNKVFINIIKYLLLRFFDGVIFYTEKQMLETKLIPKQVKKYFINNTIENIQDGLIDNYVPKNRKSILFLGRITDKSEFQKFHELSLRPEFGGYNFEVIGGNNVFDVAGCNNITFHGETTDQVLISSVLNRSIVMFYPGAVGLSVNHAANYGVPIITLENKDVMPERCLIDDFACGVVLSRATFVRDLHHLIRDYDTLADLSKNCKVAIDSEFNSQKVCKRFCDAIEGFV